MNKLNLLIVLSVLLLVGCAGNKVSEENYSGFLSDYSEMKPLPEDPETLAYINPEINWQQYDSIMIDKVLVITPDGQQKTDGKLLVAIANKYEELIRNKTSKYFNIVDNPGQGTIRIQPAITSVFTSYDDLKGYQYIPIAAAVTGAARASGVDKKSVRVMSEMRLVDSVDGEIMLQAIDLKAGKQKQDEKSGILLADVIPILEQWSQRLTDKLLQLKQAIKDRS